MDLIEIAVLAIVIIILVSMIQNPTPIRLLAGAMVGILYNIYAIHFRKQNCEISQTKNGPVPPSSLATTATELPDVSNSEKSGEYSPSPCAEQRNESATFPPPDEKTRAAISQSNLFSLNQIYGRRYGGTIDDALYVHKQRIGDRDRQATINQVKSRRNNVYEPYYRQELSEHNSKRWWEPDDVLVTKLDRRQLDTIDMGRSGVWDADIDGIYGQQ
jgi:hypothetical protein